MYVMIIAMFFAVKSSCQTVDLQKREVQIMYYHDGNECNLCHPGSYLLKQCTSKAPTECAPCPSGKFMNMWNNASSCRQCKTRCVRLFEYRAGRCSSTSDLVCRCKEGYMLTNTMNSFCHPHSNCRPGYGTVSYGTPYSDVTCKPCPNGTYSDIWSPTAVCKRLTDCSAYGLTVSKYGNQEQDNICWDGKNDVLLSELPMTSELVPSPVLTSSVPNSEPSPKPSYANSNLAISIPMACAIVLLLIIIRGCYVKRQKRNKQTDHRKSLIKNADEDERSLFMNYSEEKQKDDKCTNPLLRHTNYFQSRSGDVTVIREDNAVNIDYRKRRNSESACILPRQSIKVGRFTVSSVCIPEIGEINGFEKRNYLNHIGFESLLARTQNDFEMVKHASVTIKTEPFKYPFRLRPIQYDLDAQYESLAMIDRKITIKGDVALLYDAANAHLRNPNIPRVVPSSPSYEEIATDQFVTSMSSMPAYCPDNFQKYIPERNINVFVEKEQFPVCDDVQNYEETWVDGCSFTRHVPGVYYSFDACGGNLLVSTCSQLSIPSLAIPFGKYDIIGRLTQNIEHFGNLLNTEEGEHIVAPVIEYQVAGNKRFSRHVKLKLQHCVFDQNALENIKVYYAASLLSNTLKEVPRQSKENNIVQDMYFVVESDFIYIYTIHFTVYVVTCHGDRPMIMEAMLFASYMPSPQQELRLHAYICDRIHLLRCMKKELIDNEGKHGYKVVECKHVNLIEKMKNGARIKCKLTFGNKWQCGKDHENKEIFPLQQEFSVECFEENFSYTPTLTAEWVLHPSEQIEYFAGSMEIEMRPKEKKKKNKKKSNDMELDSVATTKFWVNISTKEYSKGEIIIKSHQTSEFTSVSDDNWLNIFQELANELEQKYIYPLVNKLKLKDADVDAIKVNFPNDLWKQKFEILHLWRNRNPDEPLKTLLDALRGAGDKLTANNISVRFLK